MLKIDEPRRTLMRASKEVVTACLTFSLLLLLSGFSGNLSASEVVIKAIDTESTTAAGLVTVATHEIDGQYYVFCGGRGPKFDVFKLEDTGEMTHLNSYPLWKDKGPARGLAATEVDGNHYLFVGNKWGNGIDIHQMEKDGSLSLKHLVEDTDETHLGVIITIEIVKIGDSSYLFAGGLEGNPGQPGLSSFKINSDGSLTHVHSIADTKEIFTDGIIAMTTFHIGEDTFVVAGGFQDSGVSSFKVNKDGSFRNISNIGDNEKRFLTGTYPLEGVTLSGNHYVVVGHRHHTYYKRGNFIKYPDWVYHGDAVTVLRMDDAGNLKIHSVLKDSEDSSLKGQTRIFIHKIDETKAIVTVGTREDKSLQTCILDAEGELTPSANLNVDYEIYNGMDGAMVDGRMFIFSGPYHKGEIHSHLLELSH